jgi:hypothetical protein
MQKTDHLRTLAQARASAQAPNQTLARLKARSFGKPTPVTIVPPTVEVPEPLQGSSPKPLVR